MSLLLCVTFLIDIVRLSSGIHPELFVYFAAVLAVATLNGQLKLYTVAESKGQTTDQGKDNYMDQCKYKSMDEQTTDQSKDKSMNQGKEKSMDQEQNRKPCKDSHSDADKTLSKDTADRDDKTQKDASGPKHQTSSQFMMTEIGPLWSECDDMAIRNMCWSPQVSTRICFPT